MQLEHHQEELALSTVKTSRALHCYLDHFMVFFSYTNAVSVGGDTIHIIS